MTNRTDYNVWFLIVANSFTFWHCVLILLLAILINESTSYEDQRGGSRTLTAD
jgi:hypothetical protein